MLIVMATLCIFFKVSAQSRNHQTTTSASLASYKAKLVILDFWATSCSACIQAFPKLELLQKEFAGQVQFVKITSEKKEKAIPFLEKMYKDLPSLIPVITDDTIYRKKYPHIYIPHYVWLNENGDLLATTNAHEVTKEHIEGMLTTGNLSLDQKVDLVPNKPLFLDTILLKNHDLNHYSLLFKGTYAGLGSGSNILRNKEGKQTGFTLSNTPLGDMYSFIASKLFSFDNDLFTSKKRIILVKDPLPLFYQKQLSSPSDYFTYITYNSNISDKVLYHNALEDLNRYSDYSATIEKRLLKCLILTASAKIDPEIQETKSGADILLVRLDAFPFIDLPVINESGYSVKYTFRLKKHKDIASLQEELKTYGLMLIEGERELHTLVIRDK